MCHPYADGYRVDMTVDLDWNAALVGAHEMGHSYVKYFLIMHTCFCHIKGFFFPTRE